MIAEGYPLQESVLLDSGATLHIFRDTKRMKSLRAAPIGDFLWSGTTQVPIDGYGEARIILKSGDGSPTYLTLYNVALCTALTTNLVSFSKLRKRGYWWDTKPGNNCLRRADGSYLGEVEEINGQQVLEYRTSYEPAATVRAALIAEVSSKPRQRKQHTSWTHRRPLKGDSLTWHRRLGHPGPEVLRYLTTASRGVRIKGDTPQGPQRITTVNCDACGTAKAHRLIRRAPREATARARPGDRIAIDFHPLTLGYAGYTSVCILTDRASGYSWDYYLTERSTPTLRSMIQSFLRMLEVQYSIKVKVIECDNEIIEIHTRVADDIRERGIICEPSAPNTQAQNGGAERVAAVIIEKSRAMRIAAKLPAYLWPEIMKAATYLYNRTPSLRRDRKTPYEIFHSASREPGDPTAKPDLAHLRSYGCKAFALTADTQLRRKRLQKQAPRAWIGFLIGYTSSNSFRIWNPLQKEILTMRDVTFNEQQHFDGHIESLRDDLLQADLEAIQKRIQELISIQEQPSQWATQLPDEEYEEVLNDEDRPCSDQLAQQDASTSEEDQHAKLPPRGEEGDGSASEYTTSRFEVLPTPPPSPPTAFFHAEAFGLDVKGRGGSVGGNDSTPARRRQRISFKAAFLAGGIQAPKHKHQSTCQIMTDGVATPVSSRAGGGRNKPLLPSQYKGKKQHIVGIHWSLLEKLPSSHMQIKSHPYRDAILKAEKAHLQSHKQSNSWEEVAKSMARGRQILGCHWVYTYKLDKHGRLVKIKARLVIRGDQQDKDERDTYAATLAGMSFRTLVALANRFDYEMLQYDAVNAFVHATIDEDIYMEMPMGYRKKGRILKLRKALYGLRRSPLLWQKHFEKGLIRTGFQRVPGEDCCWLHGDIIFFFYVDDCVLCFPETMKKEATKLMGDLQMIYHIEGGQPLQWFLGIEVIRDRPTRRLWLSQSVYVDKMKRLLPDVMQIPNKVIPMTQEELLPYEGIASPGSTNSYQRKVGTLMYAAVMTRPDIAFASSRLARFNQNPGPLHHKAADRVLWYLLQTRGHSLEFGSEPGSEEDGLQVASDASFGDNSLDRRSSQAFTMRLFGGITSWKANKQDTVTTSTTEAELLALSQAAKEALFASRLLSAMKIDLSAPTARRGTAQPSRVTIECDNKQTIRLVKEELIKLRTKLRHVDIHNHWLRQEITQGRIDVVYTSSAQLLADGFTKALPSDKFELFMQRLRLADLSEKLVMNRRRELEEEL
ncbi:hypothetical protein HZS61_008144 [Fusarium oxysporum f. sp. conglutinans]|uniref:Integrase catalytic domain-containing protein n=2 Tax=Fusarium oxysporum f. sp. conglutinans TaxID=100902 RepID=A0A8H6LGC4_FUSOX|nr:hypothetical protein HZS61_001943 [Fusarium oxysporum f. sp. conglutinans]KAF6519530.1 hypothetical protein HZS61_017904 [Fusarium oxysporum f. sp. conglutinans]KAF6523283.1 hypothetical protein HZS61_011782 [Fusarium oxysporum f. sp. conglutinans]KAF6527463.1 hypothetical protein HZS61_010507 [Fusarium oxysporum f. sp. conglutinans]KAF6527842.1 hypothetical protein HZS61_008144 [Fusarium oxysporum f. sp. conglutinans]